MIPLRREPGLPLEEELYLCAESPELLMREERGTSAQRASPGPLGHLLPDVYPIYLFFRVEDPRDLCAECRSFLTHSAHILLFSSLSQALLAL